MNENTCSSCGGALPTGAAACPGCGRALPRRASPWLFAGIAACLALLPLAAVYFKPADKPAPAPAAPRAPDAQPALRRGLADIEKKYGGGMKLESETPVKQGPLSGGVIRRYRTGPATDDLHARDGRVYRRELSFLLKDIGEDKAGFAGAVYTYALYHSAFDANYDSASVPPGVAALAASFGGACAARPGGHSETREGLVFSCAQLGERMVFAVAAAGY